jgi:hypothetical protein
MRKLIGCLVFLTLIVVHGARADDMFQDSDLVGDPIPVVPFEGEKQEEWRTLIPPTEHLTVDTKAHCDKKAGITAAYERGENPTWAQWQRFDGCQVWINHQQGIGSYR